MPTTILRSLFKPFCSWIFPIMLFWMGCSFPQIPIPESKPLPPKVEKMAVVGFRHAMSQGDEPGVIRSPVSGAVFMAEPVPQGVVKKMTDSLFAKLLEDSTYGLVSPNQVKGVFSSIVSSDLSLADIEIFQKIGQTFSADAVMVGYIYRWRERVGTDYSVNRPASVAFDLYLIRSNNRAILWKGKFDKTQKSLSENLLDMKTFLKGGGKWMTADRLGELGLADLLGKSTSYLGRQTD